MIKGYEFEKDQYVLFQPEELKALEEGSSHVIDIVAFIPEKEVDPIYYDKAYFLAPDKRGGKPYSLLRAAMRESGRCALAKWAWRASNMLSRSGQLKMAWCCNSCSMRTRCVRWQPQHRKHAAHTCRTEACPTAHRSDFARYLRSNHVRG